MRHARYIILCVFFAFLFFLIFFCVCVFFLLEQDRRFLFFIFLRKSIGICTPYLFLLFPVSGYLLVGCLRFNTRDRTISYSSFSWQKKNSRSFFFLVFFCGAGFKQLFNKSRNIPSMMYSARANPGTPKVRTNAHSTVALTRCSVILAKYRLTV